MKNQKYQVTNLGTAMILTIFIILALVTFATLSIVNSGNDSRFTQKLSDNISGYYSASNQAEVILGDIDNLLNNTYHQSPDTYIASVSSRLKDLDSVSVQNDGGRILLIYSVPVSDKQKLEVELELTDPSAADSYYKIIKWQEIMDQNWNGDNKLNVM